MSRFQRSIVLLSRSCSVLTMLALTATLLSVCCGFGVAMRWAVAGVGAGRVHVQWKTEAIDWDYRIGVFAGVFSPEFHWEPPTFDKSGSWGLQGWKTRCWLLRIPLWLVCGALAVPTGVLRLVARAPGNGHSESWRDSLRRCIALVAGFISALIVASALGLATSVLPETQAFWDSLIHVVIPLGAGAVVGTLVGRRIARRRAAREGRCAACGYDLTGNVSGRCSECGIVVRPLRAERT